MAARLLSAVLLDRDQPVVHVREAAVDVLALALELRELALRLGVAGPAPGCCPQVEPGNSADYGPCLLYTSDAADE